MAERLPLLGMMMLVLANHHRNAGIFLAARPIYITGASDEVTLKRTRQHIQLIVAGVRPRVLRFSKEQRLRRMSLTPQANAREPQLA